MRTIIAGSRSIVDYETLRQAMLRCGWVPTVILSGAASGVDQLGEQLAHKHRIPLERYPANWKAYGRHAGYLRNEEMARKAEALVALWDGKSRGTGNMIDIARRRNLVVSLYRVDDPPPALTEEQLERLPKWR